MFALEQILKMGEVKLKEFPSVIGIVIMVFKKTLLILEINPEKRLGMLPSTLNLEYADFL